MGCEPIMGIYMLGHQAGSGGYEEFGLYESIECQKLLNLLFFAFWKWLPCLVLFMMGSSAGTRMYLRYRATIGEVGPSNNVGDKACQAALRRRIFSLSIRNSKAH